MSHIVAIAIGAAIVLVALAVFVSVRTKKHGWSITLRFRNSDDDKNDAPPFDT
jgi:hypothetical protein